MVRRSGGCVYCSAINLCEYKISQFWRLLNFNAILIMRFYCLEVCRNVRSLAKQEKTGKLFSVFHRILKGDDVTQKAQ